MNETIIKHGVITKIYGTIYTIRELPKYDMEYQATIRGKLRLSPKNRLIKKRHLLTIGDEVSFRSKTPLNSKRTSENVLCGEALIEEVRTRKNQITRTMANVSHDLAANVDHVFLLTSLETAKGKNPKLNFVDRVLASAFHENIKPVLIFSKLDLLSNCKKRQMEKVLLPYINKYPHSYLLDLHNSRESINEIIESTNSQRAILIGLSGSGKSTLINQILEQNIQKTQPVNQKSKRGCHTTSNSTFFIDRKKRAWIDSPGIREWGLDHLSIKKIISAFPEYRKMMRFSCTNQDCIHGANDRDCAIQKAILSLKKEKPSIRSLSLLQILNTMSIPNHINYYQHRRQIKEYEKNVRSKKGVSHFKWKNFKKKKDKYFQSRKTLWTILALFFFGG